MLWTQWTFWTNVCRHLYNKLLWYNWTSLSRSELTYISTAPADFRLPVQSHYGNGLAANVPNGGQENKSRQNQHVIWLLYKRFPLTEQGADLHMQSWNSFLLSQMIVRKWKLSQLDGFLYGKLVVTGPYEVCCCYFSGNQEWSSTQTQVECPPGWSNEDLWYEMLLCDINRNGNKIYCCRHWSKSVTWNYTAHTEAIHTVTEMQLRSTCMSAGKPK